MINADITIRSDITVEQLIELYDSVGLKYMAPENIATKKDKSRFKANKTAKNANRSIYKGKGSKGGPRRSS